ncbi:MAG: MASE3 domain-containing protein [Clostridium sp.]|nr:MASE3 domain-containing protein [Clostridium sp.]
MEEAKLIYENVMKKDDFSILSILIFIMSIPILIVVSNKNILLFHFMVECIIIFLCFSITMLIINTQEISDDRWFKFLGLAFGFICIFELIHATLYKGMNIVGGDTIDQSIQLALCESYIRSLVIFIFLKGFFKKIKSSVIFYIVSIVNIVVLLMILLWKTFPECYIQGSEPTLFKRVSEYVICIILIASMTVLISIKEKFSKDLRIYIGIAVLFSLISEVAFTFGTDAYNLSGVVAHVFKLMSLYIIYKIILTNTLKRPLKTLNAKLLNGYEELEEINKELNSQNSELIKARSELIRRKKRYKNLIRSLPIAIILRNEKSILFANNTAINLLGAKNEKDIVGMDIFDIVHPEYIDIVKKEIENTQKGIHLDNSEEKILGLDGRSIDVEISSLPIRCDNEELVMVVFRDITSKKLSEAMEKELIETRQNEKLRTEFFANLSHEFRTPINVIYSSCQLMDIYIKQGSVIDTEKYNTIIKQNCYRILRLINNLIDTTKIDDGFYKINLRYCNVVSVIEDVVMSISAYIENKGIELIFDTEVEEKYTLCDSDILERIILNLISNAIKYGREEEGKIEVNIYDLGTSINISVKDNGGGIPAYKQKFIFERFARVDKSLNRLQEGNGIGLYIVKSLIEMHNGTISVKSKEGEGAEFTVNLPMNVPQNETMDEVCLDQSIDLNRIIEKVKIEFSDIY